MLLLVVAQLVFGTNISPKSSIPSTNWRSDKSTCLLYKVFFLFYFHYSTNTSIIDLKKKKTVCVEFPLTSHFVLYMFIPCFSSFSSVIIKMLFPLRKSVNSIGNVPMKCLIYFGNQCWSCSVWPSKKVFHPPPPPTLCCASLSFTSQHYNSLCFFF